MNPEINPGVAVVGPGAIGTTIAAALHEVGRTPLLCGRSPRDHLTLQDGDRFITVPGPVRTHPAQIARTVDLVFWQSRQHKSRRQQNGSRCWPVQKPCCASCRTGSNSWIRFARTRHTGKSFLPSWFPAQAQSDGSVRLRGEARLSLPDTSASRVVAAALQGTRCAVDLAANFSSLAWRKLMQNAVAGLMALTHRRSGMFGRADIARLTLAYLQECLAVARAEGAELGDEVPQEILDKFRAAPTDMSTSILTDREAGRPLEWDIRNGVIARRGQAHGIPTPISDILVPLLAAASDGPG